jgi:hypothetical protein
MATAIEKAPNTRKYEVGTSFDYNRLYHSYDKTVMEIEAGPTVRELWKMLKNDPQARQLVTALKLPIRRSKWDIIPSEGDTGEKDFVEWALHASARQGGMTTPMRQVVSRMANAILFRFAAFEKVWKIVDEGEYKGKVALHKLGYRPQSTVKLRTDVNGTFNGFTQTAYKGNRYKEVTFDPKRALVYVHGEDEMPIVGMTPFDVVYKIHKEKMKISFFYYAFLENVAFPRTMARVLGDDPDALQHLLQKVAQLSHQGIIGLYEDEVVEPYESARTTRDYQTALEYLDWQMAKACLAQFLDLGTSGERGSFALSRDKSLFFYQSLEAVLEDIADNINSYLIPDLVQYNFGKNAAFPRFKFRPLTDEKADSIMEIYKNILIAPSPNVTPPFLLSLMQRVEQILDLEVDPMAEYSEEDLALIMSTIPTARDHLLSKENRAGSGQNPITGEDRNENNNTPQEQEPGKKQQSKLDDSIDILRNRAPAAPTTGGRKRRKKDEPK